MGLSPLLPQKSKQILRTGFINLRLNEHQIPNLKHNHAYKFLQIPHKKNWPLPCPLAAKFEAN